jgi:hypothetical protein
MLAHKLIAIVRLWVIYFLYLEYKSSFIIYNEDFTL